MTILGTYVDQADEPTIGVEDDEPIIGVEDDEPTVGGEDEDTEGILGFAKPIPGPAGAPEPSFPPKLPPLGSTGEGKTG